MAKKEEAAKVILEREYVVNLRREFIKAPRWKKTKKAVRGLRSFLAKHMKPADMDEKNVKIGKYLNLELWKHGMKNPPHHVKLIAKKDDKGIVTAEIVGAPAEEKAEKKEKKETPKAEEKKEAAKEKVESGEKTAEKKEKKETPKAEVKNKEEKKTEDKKAIKPAKK